MYVNKKLCLVLVVFFVIAVCEAEYKFDETSSCPRLSIADFTYARSSYFGEYTRKQSEKENCVDERYDEACDYRTGDGYSWKKELPECRAFIKDISTLGDVAPILNDETKTTEIDKSNIDSSYKFFGVCLVLACVCCFYNSSCAKRSEPRKYRNSKNEQWMPSFRNKPVENGRTYVIVPSKRDHRRRDEDNRNALIAILLFIFLLCIGSSPYKPVLESSE